MPKEAFPSFESHYWAHPLAVSTTLGASKQTCHLLCPLKCPVLSHIEALEHCTAKYCTVPQRTSTASTAPPQWALGHQALAPAPTNLHRGDGAQIDSPPLK